ncbi:hypothetical protein ABPG72_000373 [Tetrahymena utriculariae]
MNIINTQKSQTTSKKEIGQATDYNNQQQQDQYKENNNKLGQQSERLSSKINFTANKDQNTKNIFNSRYGNQHQILTIILEVPSGVDKLIIENEDEVPEKAKNFCIKHNYSLDCVPQLIVQINQQIERLIQENNSQQEKQLKNKTDSQYLQNSSYKIDQLPSFQDSIFERSTQNQVNKQPRELNQNIYNQRYELNSCKKNLFAQEDQQMKNIEKQANGNSNIINNNSQNIKEEQKKAFYNIYDSHEEALSELYNRKQQEMKSLFKIEKSNKNNFQELGSNQSFNLSESYANNQSQSSKKTTKKWKRDISPYQVQNFQQHNDKQNENQVEYRSTSPLLDKNGSYPCKSEVLDEGSPARAHGTILIKENSSQNLMKNLRDQVKLQKAESSANLNKQQESKIQDLIDTNNLQNMRKNEIQNSLKQIETNQKSDFINSPIIKQNNNQIDDSNMKFHKSNSLARQISQNSSCNDQFYQNQSSSSKTVHVINSQGIKKSNSALFINKVHIQPIEDITVKQIKPTEETKKKRSISPFNNSNAQQINNKNYYKNTVSQQNKINDKSKELQSRSRSPIQTTKQNRSISNTRKKSIENNNSNISKPKVIACNSSSLICQSKEKPTNEDEKQKYKEAKSVTPSKSITKTLSQHKISRSKTPTKDQQNNQKAITQNKQHAFGTNHHNEENENNFQPQISEQSKKIAEASRQKGIGIHERLYNQAKKELKKKEQWDVQLKKILKKNQTPNSKKEGQNNQLAYFQLKSIHNNGKAVAASKAKEYVIYQNNISPFKPKEPELVKVKKRDISSEREESKTLQLKYNKSSSQGQLFHTKEQEKEKSLRNDSKLNDDKQNQKLPNFESKEYAEDCLIDDQKLIKQQQELLNYYQNMGDQFLKENKTENQHVNNICKTLENQTQPDFDNPVKLIQEGLIFQKKTQGDNEKEHVKVQQRYHTYDNEDELQKMSQHSRDSQRRDSQLSQAQNRLATQLFQNQLKQLQLQEEMKNHFKSQNQSVESIYPNQEQNNVLNPIQLNSNQSFTQIKKQEQGDEKLKKVLEYIFFALDSDSDGQISTENIDLSKLNTTILMIIQDVLIDVENLGGFVDLDCFCSLVKRRKVEQQLLDYVFSDNSLSYSPNNEERQLSINNSKYYTKSSNNNNINSVDISQKQEYFNEYEKQAVEFLSKNSHENDTILSGALLTNESITPDIFLEKKKEYFDVQEYEKKLLELQQKSNFYDLNFENKEDQHQISSRYKKLLENEQKYQKNSQSPAFANDSIYKQKN